MTEPEDTHSLEDLLGSLKRNAKAVDVYFHESRSKLKSMQKKLAQESGDPTELPLQPRTRLMKWLTDRQMPVESSFSEFFEALMEEHGKEDRLDLSARTISLNPSACVLFGISTRNSTQTLYDLLTILPSLYL
jgi:hypothetical protein